jgi:tripartite-type tricarboxylate transporter receptor subunit TctC
MPRSMLVLTALLAALLTTAAAPAAADAVAEFYAGKQIRFIIRSGVGGGYDQYSRLLGRHIGKHIPGQPSVLPINMPGGGGIRAATTSPDRAPGRKHPHLVTRPASRRALG